MDKLSREEVLHVAHLARISLTEEEIEKFRGELKVLMDDIDKIKDVKDYELVVGNPARKLGYVCRCGERLMECQNSYICKACGRRYKLANSKMMAVE